MGIFGAAHEWVEKGQKTPLKKIGHKYLKIMKLGTVIPYLRNIQKYINHVHISQNNETWHILIPYLMEI